MTFASSIESRARLKNSQAVRDFLYDDPFRRLQSRMQRPVIHKCRGSYLFFEGDRADDFYFIRKGKIKLQKTTSDGREIIYAIINEGDLIGEYYGETDGSYSYGAVALEKVEALVISAASLEDLMRESGEFAVEFSKWIGRKQYLYQKRCRDLLLFGKKEALASVLLELDVSFGIPCPEGRRLSVRLTNTEIGALIGLTRESVNRFLNSWKQEDVIDIKENHIVIKNIRNLQALVSK